jgi:REP element-mobilizing transposase RayT
MSFSRRGGARVGAGRKKQRDRGPSHAARSVLSGRVPVHVTVKVRAHVWNLRTRRCFEILCAAFVAGCNRFGMRVIGLGIQGNHLHLLVEAACAAALAAGMKGLEVRIARGLNRLMGRRGAVFVERFNAHVLRTPREVRRAMHYISRNTAKHAAQAGRRLPAGYRDPYTIGYFGARTLLPEGVEGMVVPPETWLLMYGWRRGDAPVARARDATENISAVLPAGDAGNAGGRTPGGSRPPHTSGKPSRYFDRSSFTLRITANASAT